MPSDIHFEDLSITFQYEYPLVPALSIAALIVIAALYIAHSNGNPAIPLYVPEKSAVGSQKKRWMFDSVNLLQEAYQEVRNDNSVPVVVHR